MTLIFSAPYPYLLDDIQLCFYLSPILLILQSNICTVKKIKTFQRRGRQSRASFAKEREILCEIQLLVV